MHSPLYYYHQLSFSPWISFLSISFSPSSHQRPVSCPVTDIWLQLCPQMDIVGAEIIGRGEPGDSQLPLKNNKDHFSIGVYFQTSILMSLFQFSTLDLLPPNPPAGQRVSGRTLKGGSSHFIVVYLGFDVTQLFIAE